MNIMRSKKYFELSRKYIPGGVNSPVRAFGAVGGTPVFISEGKGAFLVDVDGNRYLDLINAWGPLILGPAAEDVVDAKQQQVSR
ncbi:MAG: aminotransferase class III-fold pyridoxal phosphate-dependent enzyme, partial [Bacteroidetes bacterium]